MYEKRDEAPDMENIIIGEEKEEPEILTEEVRVEKHELGQITGHGWAHLQQDLEDPVVTQTVGEIYLRAAAQDRRSTGLQELQNN